MTTWTVEDTPSAVLVTPDDDRAVHAHRVSGDGIAVAGLVVCLAIAAILVVSAVTALVVGWALSRRPEPPAPDRTCEVCGAQGVRRDGIWDYCPDGHTYVGRRADV